MSCEGRNHTVADMPFPTGTVSQIQPARSEPPGEGSKGVRDESAAMSAKGPPGTACEQQAG